MSEICYLCGCGTEKMPLVICGGGDYKHFNQSACEIAKSHELKLRHSTITRQAEIIRELREALQTERSDASDGRDGTVA